MLSCLVWLSGPLRPLGRREQVFPFPKVLEGARLGLALGGGCWGLSPTVLLVQLLTVLSCPCCCCSGGKKPVPVFAAWCREQQPPSVTGPTALSHPADMPHPLHGDALPPGSPRAPQSGWLDPALEQRGGTERSPGLEMAAGITRGCPEPSCQRDSPAPVQPGLVACLRPGHLLCHPCCPLPHVP